MKTKSKSNKYLWIVGSLLVGLLLGWIFFSGGNKTAENHNHEISIEKESTIWTCSMHPQIRQPNPGDCPLCGMDLIPVQEEKTSANPQAVQMTEYAMKLANVQTMTVGAESSTNQIRLNGKIAVDERLAYSQSAHIPGRIEQLHINFTGEKVMRGAALAQVYSPEMVTAQEELLQAYAIRESNPRLFEAAKQKLRNWNIGEAQINTILKSGQPSERFTIRADVSGIVTEKLVELGDYVERGMPIYEITDLSKVWALFDIYENNMKLLKEGSAVEFSVASLPGKTFKGKVEFIDPILNPQTRVSTARVVVDNENGLLKPGMFVTGIVEKTSGKNNSEEISVPKSAVLWTGKRSVVYVQKSPGNFELREVVLGTSLGNSYLIEKGLQPGEKVVVNGAFTVDSAAQLAGKPSMMNPEREMDMEEKNNAQIQLPETAKTELNEFVSAYWEVKNALVSDDFSTAKEKLFELSKNLENLNSPELGEEAKTIWDSYRKRLSQEVEMLSKAKNIEDFRDGFVLLSESFIALVKSFQLVDQTLYVQYCPMAKNDKGAYWLSLSPEIRNPYFGNKMLKCGEVKDILK